MLLAEDDAFIGKLLMLALQDDGFDPLLADSVSGALRLAQERPPDVAILDLNLPDGYGTDIAGHLKGVPVIIVSAAPFRRLTERAQSVGAFAYFPKPFDLTDLLNAVHRAASAC